MRISTQLLYQRGVNAIEQQQYKLSGTQEQLATGERLKSPADDPFASTRIIALEEQSEILDQYQRNANFANSRLETEETSLISILNILQRLNELAVQSANGSLSASDRMAISIEVFEQMDSVLQLANTRDANGEYIFSGDLVTEAAYVHDGSGNFTYQGDQGQRLIEIGNNRKIATSDPGYEVFENIPDATGSSKNLMEIIYDFADTIASGIPSPNSITEIRNAVERVTSIQARIGARINTIDSQVRANESFQLSLNETRSSLADLDYAEAVSRFQQELAGLQAAQQSFLEIQNLSLFNFL